MAMLETWGLFLMTLIFTGRTVAGKSSNTYLVEVGSKNTSNEFDKTVGDYGLNVENDKTVMNPKTAKDTGTTKKSETITKTAMKTTTIRGGNITCVMLQRNTAKGFPNVI